ncbi:heat shock transcription factor, Y-linked-like [Ascaphus truei]|uniref:heat shock transcription factor, Y-linked-like n=1 Tax=Ascaphus truei TaxID=8439 RepID=UPI003F5A06C5
MVNSLNSTFSSVSPGCAQTGVGDSDLQSAIEERTFQALTEESAVDNNEFLSLTFPKKLWKIVESEQFKSIWWDDGGTCVVIFEELFKREVLERRGPFRLFETDCMKSFIRQLNLYGFSKVRQEFQRSASLSKFLAEEKAVTEYSKLQFYHNSNFRRDYPQLLGRMKRRVGIKKELGKCSSPQNWESSETEAQNSILENFSSEQQNPEGTTTTSERPSSSTARIRSGYTASPTSGRPSENGAVQQNARLNVLAPFHPAPHNCHNHVNAHGIDATTTTSSTSLYHVIPPVPNNPFSPVMGPPPFQTMYPDFTAMQAHLTSLLPFCNPWLSMPMIAAASAFSMSRSFHHRAAPSYHHCPNCNCSVRSSSPATGGANPPEYMGFHR